MLTPTRLADVIAEQEAVFVKRQPKSAAFADRAAGVLAAGVTSNWQITRPQPVWLSHGAGGEVNDAVPRAADRPVLDQLHEHGGNGGPALNALGSIMLAMSLITVIIGYVGYRLLTRGERGSGLSALTAISGEA